MRRVVIESPFAGDRQRNNRYLLACLRDCYARGEAPIASHLIGPLVLDDDVPAERQKGIEAGLAWHAVADCVAFYTDLGWSRGMKEARARAEEAGVAIEIRSLPDWQGSSEAPDIPPAIRRLAEAIRLDDLGRDLSAAMRAIPALVAAADATAETARWIERMPCKSEGAWREEGRCLDELADPDDWCEPCTYLETMRAAAQRLRHQSP